MSETRSCLHVKKTRTIIKAMPSINEQELRNELRQAFIEIQDHPRLYHPERGERDEYDWYANVAISVLKPFIEGIITIEPVSESKALDESTLAGHRRRIVQQADLAKDKTIDFEAIIEGETLYRTAASYGLVKDGMLELTETGALKLTQLGQQFARR